MNSCLENPTLFIGCLWSLNTRREGIVEGILKDYYPGNDSFTFDKAERKEDEDGEDSEFLGLIAFFRHEILSAEVVECNEEVRQRYLPAQTTTVNKDSANENYRISKKDLQSNPDSDDDSNETSSESDDEIVSLCGVNEEDFNVEFDIDTSSWKAPFTETLEWIDSLTSETSLREILTDIRSMKMIGVAGLGENVSRFGFIHTVLVSTDNANYIFCEDTWITILKDVFESRSITKIIHGSGFFADTLFRKYKIRIENVCDTQVLDFFIRQKEKNKKKKQLLLYNYRKCLREYLGIEVPAVFSRKNFSRLKASHPSDAFDNFLRMRIMPLKQLRWILFERYLEEVHFATELFMRGMSESSDVEFNIMKDNICSLISQKRRDFPSLPVPEHKYSEEDYMDKNVDVTTVLKNFNYQPSHPSVLSYVSVKQLSRHMETILHCRDVNGLGNFVNGTSDSSCEELSDAANISSDISLRSNRSSSVETVSSSESDDVIFVSRAATAIQSSMKDYSVGWLEDGINTRYESHRQPASHSHLFQPAGSESNTLVLPGNSLYFNGFY